MDMDKSRLFLTVIFDNPFYKAIFERYTKNTYEVAQINLGASNPKLPDIYNLVLKHWNRVEFFKQNSEHEILSHKRINPKRRQRLAQKSINKTNGTKAQLALKKQFEQKKKVNKSNRRLEIKRLKQKKFQIKQVKKLKKHKGH